MVYSLPTLIALALAGCTTPEEETFLPEVGDFPDEAAVAVADPARRAAMTLGAPTSPYYGTTGTVDVTGATPGETVYLAYSLDGTGAGICPGVLGGLCLEIINEGILGTAVASGSGTATFSIPFPASGPDPMAVWLQAAHGGATPATTNVVSFDLTYDNGAPIANPDSYSTQEDSPITIGAAFGLLANDSDPDGDPLTIIGASNPTLGALDLDVATGAFTYTPGPNLSGTDTFDYYVVDGLVASDTVTVTIQVQSVNDAPVGKSDTYNVGVVEDTFFTSTESVLDNDSDIEGHALTAVIDSQPAGGVVTLRSDGQFDFNPYLNYDQETEFTYRAVDSQGAESDPVSVLLKISARNDAPVAVDTTFEVQRDTRLDQPSPGVMGGATDVDGPFPLTAELAGNGPNRGTLHYVNTDGSFGYTPDLCYRGIDDFNVKIRDGEGKGAETVVATLEVALDAPLDLDYCDAFEVVEDPEGLVWTTINGHSAWYIVPPDPTALVFLFHGGKGTANETTGFEWDVLTNAYLDNGFAVAALSANTSGGAWDESDTNWRTNEDWPNMEAFRDDLIANTAVTASLPIFAHGFSSGGCFSGSLSFMALDNGWPFRGSLINNCTGNVDNAVPALWVAGEKDTSITESEVRSAAASHGGPTELYVVLSDLPLHEMYFTRHAFITNQESLDHFNALLADGVITADGVIAISSGLTAYLDGYEAAHCPPLTSCPSITMDMSGWWGQHRITSRFIDEQVAFILNYM